MNAAQTEIIKRHQSSTCANKSEDGRSCHCAEECRDAGEAERHRGTPANRGTRAAHLCRIRCGYNECDSEWEWIAFHENSEAPTRLCSEHIGQYVSYWANRDDMRLTSIARI